MAASKTIDARQAAVESESGCAGAARALAAEKLAQYRRLGFVVRRGVFDAAEMAEFAAESERLLAERRELIDRNNLRCRFMPHVDSGEPLFEVFDPVTDLSPTFTRLAADPRILAIVASIYGEPASLFKEKLIYKPPGALGYDLHQDIPRQWAGFPRSFLTVLVPIDEATEANGCTEVFSGYHHEFIVAENSTTYMLPADAVDASRSVKLLLAPGDVAVFHGLTPHRSSPNRSTQSRRAFYASYNARSEGGDQRAKHYAEFHDKLKERLSAADRKATYFL
jgi:ectoine hydroxylase-related dioxygenase (phytanoyl-CoA dioxygenase family)